MSGEAKASLVLLAVAGVAHALVALALPLVPSNDSIWYLAYTHALSAREVFDPYAPGVPREFDIVAPLGYSLLLDVGVALVGWARLGTALIVFQHALGVASTLLLHRLGVLTGAPRAGFAAGLLYALFLPAAIYCQLVLSESLFVFLVIACVACFLRWWPTKGNPGDGRDDWRWLLGTGIALGAACLVRYPALLFGGVLTLGAWLRGGSLARHARVALLLLGPPLLLLIATVVHNGLWFGHYTFTDASGRHLSNRLWAFEQRFDPGEEHGARILALCRESGIDFTAPSAWWNYHRALRVGGDLGPAEADRLIRDMAIGTILRDPWAYLSATPLALAALIVLEDNWAPPLDTLLDAGRWHGWVKGWSTTPESADTLYIPPAVFEARRALVERLGIGATRPAAGALGPALRAWDHLPRWDGALAWLLVFAWLVMAAGGRREQRLLAGVALALLLTGALSEYPFPRYRQPVIPFALLLLTSAIAFGWHGLTARTGPGRALPSDASGS